MTDDFYLIAITALLPLTAIMLVIQVNPYQALVMRGILGAIAALVYALFGAADVALTEALVGTMLSITLYAVAVRSSMEMRLGWVPPADRGKEQVADAETDLSKTAEAESDASPKGEDEQKQLPATLDEALIVALKAALKPEYLRLEMVPYPSLDALEAALNEKRIHSAVLPATAEQPASEVLQPTGTYRLQTRVQRLYEILSDRLPIHCATVDYWDVTQSAPAGFQPSSTQSSLANPVQESP